MILSDRDIEAALDDGLIVIHERPSLEHWTSTGFSEAVPRKRGPSTNSTSRKWLQCPSLDAKPFLRGTC